MTIGLLTERLGKTFASRKITRFAIAFIILGMVISSPIFMLVNPAQVSAASLNDNPNRIDSSGYHSTPSIPAAGAASPLSSSTPMVPAASSQGNTGDFTTQAALSLTRAAQTNNFVASKAYYDISFRTATAGAIKSVVMDFPAGTSVGSALIVEAVGIGPGTLAASAGEVLTYTVTNAVNVPALTNIRIQISNINNPATPCGSLTVSITTRDSAATPIDGPTPTSAYNMVQVGNAQIAPGAVTTTKIATGAVSSTDVAESFMKEVILLDGTNGWNPDGVTTDFLISEPAITCDVINGANCSYISMAALQFSNVNHFCDYVALDSSVQNFRIKCSTAPSDGDILQYVVVTLPLHVP